MGEDKKMLSRGRAGRRGPAPVKPDEDLKKNGIIAILIAAICIAVCVSVVFFLIRFIAAALGIIFLLFGVYEIRNYLDQKDQWNRKRR
jgi:hypothetical protein